MQCEPEECQKLELLHSYTKMVSSSVQRKASVAFLILCFMVFDCSSVPLDTNNTNSKLTPTNSTINMDYHQSFPHDINEHISTNKTSQAAEAKPQSYVNKSQNDVTFLKDEETSLMNNVKNDLAAVSTHNSRRFHRSKRSTGLSMLAARHNITSEILKWINYVANCAEENYSIYHGFCSVSSSEVSYCIIHIHLYTREL
jgi:hypothetical protein